MPMGPIAKRLVLRRAAAAERVVLLRCTLAKCHPHQLNSTCDRVGTIVGYRHHRLAVLISVFDVLDRIAQCTGRAFLDCFNNFFSTCAIRINPRLLVHPKHRFKTIGAEPRVATDSTVVVNGDTLANVTDTPVLGVVCGPLVGEPVGSVGSVAERLAVGTATAAEGYPSNSGTRLPIRPAQVGHRAWRHVVEEVVRTVW